MVDLLRGERTIPINESIENRMLNRYRKHVVKRDIAVEITGRYVEEYPHIKKKTCASRRLKDGKLVKVDE